MINGFSFFYLKNALVYRLGHFPVSSRAQVQIISTPPPCLTFVLVWCRLCSEQPGFSFFGGVSAVQRTLFQKFCGSLQRSWANPQCSALKSFWREDSFIVAFLLKQPFVFHDFLFLEFFVIVLSLNSTFLTC